SEARLLTVTPYDKSSIKAIEKAIMESDVGLTPSNDGNVIRLTIPELTEERRKELVKVVRKSAEEGRVAIRNVRRDVMHELRVLGEWTRRAGSGGAPRGRPGAQADRPQRGQARRRGAHRVRLLDRELEPSARGGGWPDGHVRRPDPIRDPRAQRRGRAHALHR